MTATQASEMSKQYGIAKINEERDDINWLIFEAIKKGRNYVCVKDIEYKQTLVGLLDDGFKVEHICDISHAIKFNVFWRFFIFGRFYLITW